MSSADKIVKQSLEKVFYDCLLPNGAIVAAPSHQPYYPQNAKNYLYVWPGRDAGFALAAMLVKGHDNYEPFLEWVWEKAEDFKEGNSSWSPGILFRSYYTNGLIREHQFQPDQNGTLLWSLGFKFRLKGKLTRLEANIMNALAFGLVSIWKEGSFLKPIEDLWEERGFETGQGNFSYSLASCSVGLREAGEILKNNYYLSVSGEMSQAVREAARGHQPFPIPRGFGSENKVDEVPDASLLGIIWPFDVGFEKEQLLLTLNHIEGMCSGKEGIDRYPNDVYEGAPDKWPKKKNQRAGAWPLLTFWASIACSQLGLLKKSRYYFDLGIKSIDEDGFLPEQTFAAPNSWRGIRPLLWSHAMSVFALWKLNSTT